MSDFSPFPSTRGADEGAQIFAAKDQLGFPSGGDRKLPNLELRSLRTPVARLSCLRSSPLPLPLFPPCSFSSLWSSKVWPRGSAWESALRPQIAKERPSVQIGLAFRRYSDTRLVPSNKCQTARRSYDAAGFEAFRAPSQCLPSARLLATGSGTILTLTLKKKLIQPRVCILLRL